MSKETQDRVRTALAAFQYDTVRLEKAARELRAATEAQVRSEAELEAAALADAASRREGVTS